MLSPWKLILIIVIVLIVFGAGKLPKVMGDIGKGLRHFKDGLHGKDEENTADTAAKHQQKLEHKTEIPPAQVSTVVETEDSKKS